MLPCLLTACAQGIGFDEGEYTQADGGVVVDTSVPRQDSSTPSVDAGGVSPSYDSGMAATQDTSVPSVDTGGPVGEDDASVTPTPDAATPPRDASTDTGAPVTMDASSDTGAPVTMDSGPEAGPPDTGPATPDTSTNPNQCAATPAYPTTTECAKCICSKCGAPVKQCYASGEAAKDANCAKVQECAEKNKCVDQACYCTDTLSCLGTPNGPCVSVIEQVAGTNNALDISRLGDDTSHPLGRAAAIGACEIQNCRSQCGL